MVLTSDTSRCVLWFCVLCSTVLHLTENGGGEVGEVGRLLVRFYLRLKKCCVIVYCVLSVGIVGIRLVSDV